MSGICGISLDTRHPGNERLQGFFVIQSPLTIYLPVIEVVVAWDD